MAAPRPILKSLPVYTPDTMKPTRTTRFDVEPNVYIDTAGGSDHTSDNDDPECSDGSESTGPPSPALPFACTAHIPPFSPHVHFPPTPKLTQMAMTHSSISYDRKPIEVQPNELALPARGERELELDSESDVETDVEEDEDDAFRECTTAWKTFGEGEVDQGYFQLRKPSYDVQVVDSMDVEEPESDSEQRSCSFATSSRRGSPKAATKPMTKTLRPQTPYFHPAQACSSPDAEPISQTNTTTTYDTLLPPPPALVFDPSSESDSDLCISPDNGSRVQSPEDVTHMPHLSEMSLHLVGLSPKLHHVSAADADDAEIEYANATEFGHAASPSPIYTRKRTAGDRHQSPREDGKRHKRGRSPRFEVDGDSGCRTIDMIASAKRLCDASVRQRSIACRPSSQFSTFPDGGLDGCLGGF